MSLRTFSAATVAAVLLSASTAAAAPDRTATAPLSKDGDKYTWSTDAKTGAVYGSPVSNYVPACSPLFSCDSTLIQVGEHDTPLDLIVDIVGVGTDVGGQNTMKDVDVHVYTSDKDGTEGELLVEGTSGNPAESVYIGEVQPGYYLIYVDWFTGYGSVDGTAKVVPTPPLEEEEEF